MKYLLVILLGLISIPMTARGQFIEFFVPLPSSKAGTPENLNRLLERCSKDGGLKYIGAPDQTNGRHELVDVAKLRATITSNRDLLTPDTLNALLDLWLGVEKASGTIGGFANLGESIGGAFAPAPARKLPPPPSLLRIVGVEMKNDRLLAFASYFTAKEYETLSDYKNALEEYRQAIELHKKEMNLEWQVHCLNNIGTIYAYQGEYVKALENLRDALSIRPEAPMLKPFQATIFDNIGFVHQNRNEYELALASFKKALAIREAISRDKQDLAAIAISYMNIGSVYRNDNANDKALGYFQKALTIWNTILTEKKLDFSTIIEKGLGPDSNLVLQREKALNILRAEYGQGSTVLINSLATLDSIGLAYQSQKQYTEALKELVTAFEARRNIYGEAHPAVAVSLLNIAGVYQSQGEDAKAMDTLIKGVSALRQVPGKPLLTLENLGSLDLQPMPLTVELLLQCGRMQERVLGKTPDIEKLRQCAGTYHLAIEMLDRVRREVLQSRDSKVLHGDKDFDLFPRYIGICLQLFEMEGKAEDLEAAFSAAEQGTARALLEALVIGSPRARAMSGVQSDLGIQEDLLRKQLQENDVRFELEQSKTLANRNDVLVENLRKERDQLVEKLQQLIDRMKRENPRYAALRYPQPNTIAECRACLGQNEVALLYVLGSDSSYVVLVDGNPKAEDKSGGLVVKRLPGADEIGNKMSGLIDSVSNGRSAPGSIRSLGAQAYELLIASLSDRILGKNLVIVPSGVLCKLPFELLLGKAEAIDEDEHYLIESHRVRYAPSLSILYQIRQWEKTRVTPTRPLWAMGDPMYAESDDRLAGEAKTVTAKRREALAEYDQLESQSGRPLGEQLKRLKFSGEEVLEIANILNLSSEDIDTDVHTGRSASESVVQESLRSSRLAQARYIHFAVHGILVHGLRRPSSLVLSLVGEQANFDGFLDTEEVLALNLNADLVVLSSCRSGGGRVYNGEGVDGLAQAFLYAGGRAVLCSLWSVADQQETVTMMKEIYTNLKAGKPAPDALRAAQLKMIRAGKPPFYWAPFVLIGE